MTKHTEQEAKKSSSTEEEISWVKISLFWVFFILILVQGTNIIWSVADGIAQNEIELDYEDGFIPVSKSRTYDTLILKVNYIKGLPQTDLTKAALKDIGHYLEDDKITVAEYKNIEKKIVEVERELELAHIANAGK